VRTVRLRRAFRDGQRAITIMPARTARKCACGILGHTIAAGEIYAYIVDHRTGERQHWHGDHLQDQWTLVVIDADDQEVARFGC
jgi:hypothetical protein